MIVWWFVRGLLCKWGLMGCKPVPTAPPWDQELGPKICAYCWEPTR